MKRLGLALCTYLFTWATLVVSLSGCAGNSGAFRKAVSDRAPFDIECPSGQTSVHEIGGNSYGVIGCNRKASYTCLCAWSVMGTCTQPMCSLDGIAKPSADAPAH